MADITGQTVQQIADLARKGLEKQGVDNGTHPFIVIPSDCKVESLERIIFNEHQPRPERVRQSIIVLDPESFIAYYSLFSDTQSRVFANEPASTVLGILDYHAAGEGNAPRWGHHKLTLKMEFSEEWKRWTGKNGKQMMQMEFAEFLEQNAVDISKPTPSAIMDVARDLDGTTEVQFGSGTRTQSGNIRFKYTEQTKTSVGGAAVEIPERFTLSIPVYIGGPRMDVEALLRYRIKEGSLTFFFTLVRPEEAQRNAFLSARQVIADKLGIAIINGTVA